MAISKLIKYFNNYLLLIKINILIYINITNSKEAQSIRVLSRLSRCTDFNEIWHKFTLILRKDIGFFFCDIHVQRGRSRGVIVTYVMMMMNNSKPLRFTGKTQDCRKRTKICVKMRNGSLTNSWPSDFVYIYGPK